MKIKLSELFKYPVGTEIMYNINSYMYLGRDEIGYYFFDGYTIVYDEEIWPDMENTDDIEIYLKPFEFKKNDLINALTAYILILIEDTEINKEDIDRLKSIIKIIEDINV